MQPDYNIEFAHIYADEHFGESQIQSIKVLKKVIKKLDKQNKSYVLGVLIDDYHCVNPQINIKQLIQKIESFDINVDFIGFESKLTKHVNELIKKLPKEILRIDSFQSPQKEVLTLNCKSHKIGLRVSQYSTIRHTCAVLSAVWTLSRLGIYHLSRNQIRKFSNKPFVAKNTITILPKKYKTVEDKVIKIIEKANFDNLLSKINYEFY